MTIQITNQNTIDKSNMQKERKPDNTLLFAGKETKMAFFA